MKLGCCATLVCALVLLRTAVATPTHFPGQEPMSQGCYVSMGLLSGDGAAASRPLPFMVGSSDAGMTIEVCRQRAANRLVSVFGLEYGRECWLDPANGTLETLRRLGGSEECTMACSGDASYTCGGPWAVNLYTLAASSLNIELPTYRTEALGCFWDDQLARRMWPLWVSSGAMDVQRCAHIAAQEGVLFFALQNGNECWGSQDVAHAQGLGNSTSCNMPCANTAETCGGPLSNELFRHLDAPWIADAPAASSNGTTGSATDVADTLSGTGLTGSTGPTGPSSDPSTAPASGPTGGESGPNGIESGPTGPTTSTADAGSTSEAGTGGGDAGPGPTGPVDPLLQMQDPLAQASNLVSTPQAASPLVSQQAERSAAAPVSPQNVLLAAVLAGAVMLQLVQ